MKTQIFTLIIAAGFITTPVYAQHTHHLTPVDPAPGEVIRVEESRTTTPSGRTVIERTVSTTDDTSAAPATINSTPVLVYDGIEEPLYLDEATDNITTDTTVHTTTGTTTQTRSSVTYHFE